MSNMIIPISIPSSEDEKRDTFKWTVGNNSKYETQLKVLTSLELEHLVPHVLEVKTKVDAAVGTVNHKGPSLYKVFPRTLSLVLRSVWDQIIADAPAGAPETEATFAERAKEFIAVHATVEDRHDLIQQLRVVRKPRDMLVQAFWYRLREINAYVEWLPGNENELNNDQLKQAFYDAMPATWKERFVNAGNSISTLALAQVIRYFRQQENQANMKKSTCATARD